MFLLVVVRKAVSAQFAMLSESEKLILFLQDWELAAL